MSLFESCMADDGATPLQEGGGLAQFATTISPVLEQFRAGLMSLGSSVLKKLKTQSGRGGFAKRATTTAAKGRKKKRKPKQQQQSGQGRATKKVQKGKGAATAAAKPRKGAATQKGKGSAQAKKKPTAARGKKKAANF